MVLNHRLQFPGSMLQRIRTVKLTEVKNPNFNQNLTQNGMGMPYRALPCSQSVQIMASVYVWIIDTVKGLLFWQLHVGLGVGLFDIDSSHLNGIHFKGAQMYREVGNMLFYTEISVCSDEVWVRFSASFWP